MAKKTHVLDTPVGKAVAGVAFVAAMPIAAVVGMVGLIAYGVCALPSAAIADYKNLKARRSRELDERIARAVDKAVSDQRQP